MRRRLLIVCCLFGLVASAQVGDSALSPADKAQQERHRQYDVLFHEAMLQRQRSNHDAVFDLLSRCLELRPEASETCFFLAQYYAEMKQSEQALRYYQRAAGLMPGNMTYMETLAQAYIAADRYAEATLVVEQMYETDKGREDLLETLYRLYLQQKDYEKAISVLDRMELIDGKSERLSLAKSRLYVEMGEKQKALDEVRRLAEQFPYDLGYRTLYANTLMINGQEQQADEVLRQVLDEEPDNVRAQVVLRNLFINMGDEAAADSMNHVILLNPHASTEDRVNQLRQIIIETEQEQGDSMRVVGLFRDILAQPQPDADIAEMLAAYMDLKKMPRDSVEAAFQYVLQLEPDRASSRLHLVQMAWEQMDDDRIVSLCQAARQYNPEEMAFYYYQGMAYYRKNDTDHALEAFKNGISVINDDSRPEIVSDFYAVMGDLLHQKGREAEAFAAYDSCLHWKSDNLGCLNNYAYFLSLRGERLNQAEQMSYRTVKAEPENSTYLDTYAWILFQQERYTEARVYIDQALQYDDTQSADILEHAGDIYALCNDLPEAIVIWQKALAQSPENKLLIRKIKRKKYLKK